MSNWTKLNEIDRIRALVKAETWLLKRKSAVQVKRALRMPVAEKGCGLTAAQSESVIQEVYEMWREESTHVRMEAREYLLKTLDNLYAESFENKRFETCLGISKLLAQLHGVADAAKQAKKADAAAGEFDGRSEDEIDFYIKHDGRWPEEINIQ